LQEPLSKNPSPPKKGAGGVAQGIGPEFKPQHWEKKKNHTVLFVGRSLQH
jgi:hypothetical protein